MWAQTGSELNGLLHSGVAPATDAPDLQLQFAAFHFMDGAGPLLNYAPDVEAAVTAKAGDWPHFVSVTSGLQRALSKGSLTLQSSDPLVPPLIDPRHLSHPRDLPAIVNGLTFPVTTRSRTGQDGCPGLEMVLAVVRNSTAMAGLEPESVEDAVPGCEAHALFSRVRQAFQ